MSTAWGTSTEKSCGWTSEDEGGYLSIWAHIAGELFRSTATKFIDGAERKGFALPYAPSWRSSTFTDLDFESTTQEAYKQNAVVSNCIRALSFGFPEAELRVYSEKNDEPLPDHDLQDRLWTPNEFMSQEELLLILVTYLAIGGNCYIHKVRSADGRVVELWPYHVGQITPIPGRDRFIQFFRYTNGADAPIDIAPEDIIHVKWPKVDPLQPWIALSPIRSITREIATDNEATRYELALLKNDATPKTVLTQGPNVRPDGGELLKRQFEQGYGGDKRGKVGVLPMGVDIKRIALDLDELGMDSLRATPEARIASEFGVPAIIAGLKVGLDHATYANFGEARRLFTEGTLSMLWRLVAGSLTRGLANEFGGGIYLWFDTKTVTALQANETEVSARIVNEFKEGLRTKNEARRALGLEDAEGGDTFAGADADTGGDDPQGSSGEGDLPGGVSEDGSKASGRSESKTALLFAQETAVYLKAYDDRSTATVGRLAKKLAGVFDQLEGEIFGRLKKGAIVGTAIEVKREAPIDSDQLDQLLAGELLDEVKWGELFAAATSSEVLSHVAKTFEHAVTEVGANWRQIESDFDRAISQALEGSIAKIREAVPTVKSELRDLLIRNRDLAPADLSDLIRAKFNHYRRARAENIARTTTTYATGTSQRSAWKHLDIDYEWLTGSNPRDTHAVANGSRPGDDGMFKIGDDIMPHPGAGNSAKENCNCNCVLRARPKRNTP
jgi:HK97 family phage portal protein